MKRIFRQIFTGFVTLTALTAVSCAGLSPSAGSAGNESAYQGITGLHPLGARFDSPSVFAKKSKVIAKPAAGTLPSSFDLSSVMPPVGNQGSSGSCVAWATTYSLLTYNETLSNKWNPSNTSHEFSPAWVYNQINSGVDDGAIPSDAFNLIVARGCDTLDNFPFNDLDWTTQPDSASFARAVQFEQTSWSFVNQDVDTLKQVLVSGKPVVIAMMIFTPDFDLLSPTNQIYDTTNAYTNYLWSITTNRFRITTNYLSSYYRGGHAVCLVGYDDSIQAFHFINQWGTAWGMNGYGWISYSFVDTVINESLTFD